WLARRLPRRGMHLVLREHDVAEGRHPAAEEWLRVDRRDEVLVLLLLQQHGVLRIVKAVGQLCGAGGVVGAWRKTRVAAGGGGGPGWNVRREQPRRQHVVAPADDAGQARARNHTVFRTRERAVALEQWAGLGVACGRRDVHRADIPAYRDECRTIAIATVRHAVMRAGRDAVV